tara:strand:- start:1898 stop:2749 length:852 start_codon:yes stop_codon:yes gene_type:complete
MRNHFLRAAAGNVSGAPNIVTTNLVQHFDFGDTNSYNTSVSTTTITDLSGAGNHAFFLNAPTFSTSNGGYIQPTASNQYAQKGTPTGAGSAANQSFMRSIGTGNYTIEIWMNIFGQGGSQDPAYQDTTQEVSFSPTFSFNFYYHNLAQHLNFRLGSQGHEGSTNIYNINITNGTSTANVPVITIDPSNHYTSGYNGWEQFVVSRTSTSTNGLKYYRNNSLLRTSTNSINYVIPQIGGGVTDVVHYFKNIDSRYAIFRFYKGHGLTATEVDQNYQAQKARFGLS